MTFSAFRWKKLYYAQNAEKVKNFFRIIFCKNSKKEDSGDYGENCDAGRTAKNWIDAATHSFRG
jgi:hypothetical protein